MKKVLAICLIIVLSAGIFVTVHAQEEKGKIWNVYEPDYKVTLNGFELTNEDLLYPIVECMGMTYISLADIQKIEKVEAYQLLDGDVLVFFNKNKLLPGFVPVLGIPEREKEAFHEVAWTILAHKYPDIDMEKVAYTTDGWAISGYYVREILFQLDSATGEWDDSQPADVMISTTSGRGFYIYEGKEAKPSDPAVPDDEEETVYTDLGSGAPIGQAEEGLFVVHPDETNRYLPYPNIIFQDQVYMAARNVYDARWNEEERTASLFSYNLNGAVQTPEIAKVAVQQMLEHTFPDDVTDKTAYYVHTDESDLKFTGLKYLIYVNFAGDMDMKKAQQDLAYAEEKADVIIQMTTEGKPIKFIGGHVFNEIKDRTLEVTFFLESDPQETYYFSVDAQGDAGYDKKERINSGSYDRILFSNKGTYEIETFEGEQLDKLLQLEEAFRQGQYDVQESDQPSEWQIRVNLGDYFYRGKLDENLPKEIKDLLSLLIEQGAEYADEIPEYVKQCLQ